MRIVVSEFMDPAALSGFKPGEVLYEPKLFSDAEALHAALADASALIVRNRTQVTAELLDAAPNLKVVGRLGVGLDNIDLDACRERGVAVRPATGANAQSVAEYVIAATLMLLRGAYGSNDLVTAGKWPRSELMGSEAGGKTMALWGFGNVARKVAGHAAAIGMEVCAHDPLLDPGDPAWSGARRCDDADALLEEADVLSLHVPLTDGTRGMVGAGTLSKLRPGAVLVNTARGGVVDEEALCEALRSGALGGAALDVFETEPLTEEAGARFRGVPNLILTPHVAGVTKEGDVRVSAMTVANVLQELGAG